MAPTAWKAVPTRGEEGITERLFLGDLISKFGNIPAFYPLEMLAVERPLPFLDEELVIGVIKIHSESLSDFSIFL
jgi:hypothetical protein